MKVRGKVLEVEPLVSGTSDNGNDWERQQVIVETLELDPQVLAVDFMGQRRTEITKTLKPGDIVIIEFKVRCRKWGDKWFTGLDGTFISVESRLGGQTAEAPTDPPVQMPEEDDMFGETPYDALLPMGKGGEG